MSREEESLDLVQGDAMGDDDGQPVYDLRWGQLTLGEHIMVEDAGAFLDDDGPTYDLRWGDSTWSPEPKQPEVIDLTSKDGPSNNLGSGTLANSRDDDVIDLTDEDGPTYDLRWGSPLTPPPSPGAMELDVEDDMATSLDDLDAHAAEQLMNQINHWLKAIGNTFGKSDDEHAHAIVENAVHGLNDSRAPGQVLMDNQELLGWFTDTRNQVTNVGQDMCQLHRLVHLQRRMLDTVNHVIASLETDE
ncbi:hypothetical protein BDR05DRAFT_949741 [Suillus weaverae]|nr:hypothetical protein BDR05DRAFT_949741 [Suillus weaverae]